MNTKEVTIKPPSLISFVRSLSGFFITKDNPNGITAKEMEFICHLIEHAGNNEITDKAKQEISTKINQGFQVTTNYINKLRKKKVIEGNRLNRLFFINRLTIEYGR